MHACVRVCQVLNIFISFNLYLIEKLDDDAVAVPALQ